MWRRLRGGRARQGRCGVVYKRRPRRDATALISSAKKYEISRSRLLNVSRGSAGARKPFVACAPPPPRLTVPDATGYASPRLVSFPFLPMNMHAPSTEGNPPTYCDDLTRAPRVPTKRGHGNHAIVSATCFLADLLNISRMSRFKYLSNAFYSEISLGLINYSIYTCVDRAP